MISIHLNKHNIDYVKHNDLNGTKVRIIQLFVKRISMSWETLYNFVLSKQTMIRNEKSLQEWSCVATHDLRRNKISFFYIHNPWNMILRPFYRSPSIFDHMQNRVTHRLRNTVGSDWGLLSTGLPTARLGLPVGSDPLSIKPYSASSLVK